MEKLNAKLENLSEQLGGVGKFQIGIFLLNCLAVIMPGLGIISITFVGYESPYRCLVPACESPLNSSYNQPFLNFSTPYDVSQKTWDSCDAYVLNSTSEENDTICQTENVDKSLKTSCSEWVYDTSIFKSTTVTEFSLTCNRSWLRGFAGSAFMIGILLGAVFLGDLSDRIGRRKGLVIALFIHGMGGVIGAVSNHYTLFLISRVIAGVGSIPVFQIAFILVLEYFPSKYRNFAGIMIEIPFALGEASTALIAYYIREWRWLHLACSLPTFLFIPYWWIMPESIKWLVSKGRLDEAKKIIQQISKTNNIEISKDIYDQFTPQNREIQISVINTPNPPAKSFDDELFEDRNVFLLLKHPKIFKRTLNLVFCWIVVNLAYYGLSSNASNLSGNVFVNVAAIMLIEIPSYIFSYLILDRIGRRASLSFNLLLGGVACLISGLLSQDKAMTIMVFSMIGKFGASAAFAIVYIFTAELYPTAYRSFGLGLCSMASRIGGIFAPLVADLAKIYKPLPLLIFGTISLASGALVLLLPETLGTELPMTIEEAEDLGANQSLLHFPCCSKTKKMKVTSPTS